jgi:uncharacterized protein YjbI with pentapeptide repeats
MNREGVRFLCNGSLGEVDLTGTNLNSANLGGAQPHSIRIVAA